MNKLSVADINKEFYEAKENQNTKEALLRHFEKSVLNSAAKHLPAQMVEHYKEDLLQEGYLAILKTIDSASTSQPYTRILQAIDYAMKTYATELEQEIIIPAGTLREVRSHIDGQTIENSLDETMIDNQYLLRKIKEATTTLNDQHKKVLGARFTQGFTLDEVGAYFGVTRERIRQIEITGINKLRGMYKRIEAQASNNRIIANPNLALERRVREAIPLSDTTIGMPKDEPSDEPYQGGHPLPL